MNHKDYMLALGVAVVELRRERKMTREDLARMTGLSYNVVTNIELGRRTANAAHLWEIAVACGSTLTELAKLAEIALSEHLRVDDLDGDPESFVTETTTSKEDETEG